MAISPATVLIVSVLALALPNAHAATQNLPDLGDESGAVMSPHEERKLGEEIMRHIRGSPGFVTDPDITQYLQSLGQRLVAHSDAASTGFQFFAIDDSTVNAFALPAGYVGVHTGLILTAQSESELAAVMAHEIAHVTQRHIHRMIAQSARTSKQMIAGLVAALLLGVAGQAEGSQAALALSTAGAVQQQLNFSRANEEEADRVGMQVLAAAGYDPVAMPVFFERMQNYGRLYETNLPEFLRTHPVTTNRIAESRDRAERYPYRQIPDSVEFHRIRAKIRATTKGNATDIAKTFSDNLTQGKYRNLEAERYGYTLALLQTKDYDGARGLAAELVREHPDTLAYLILRAEVEIAAGQYTKALGHYADAEKRFPRNGVLARYHAAALLKAGNPRVAMKLLRQTIENDRHDPSLQKMLATAAGESGELFEAHRALASYYYLSGNPEAALQQLQIAKRFVGDNDYLQASLEARIKEIQDEVAQGKRK